MSVIKSRRLKWAGHLTRMEEDRYAFKIRKDDNIRMELKEIGISTTNWVNSTDCEYRHYWK